MCCKGALLLCGTQTQKGCEIITNIAQIIKRYLALTGRRAYLCINGEVTEVCCALEQLWKKDKTRFEESSSPIGKYYRDYYSYIGPYDVDVSNMDANDYFIISGERYYLMRCEKVEAGGKTLYYRAALKKGDDDDLFE